MNFQLLRTELEIFKAETNLSMFAKLEYTTVKLELVARSYFTTYNMIRMNKTNKKQIDLYIHIEVNVNRIAGIGNFSRL